jgi:DeoR family transcriptional regulator, aga operon transcriptional repressor
MRTEQRRREIVRRLYLTRYVEARELAADLGVDASTIRRDLDALSRAGHMQRTHGGARLLSGAVDLPYEIKRREWLAAKQAIGCAAAELVADGQRVALDSGSTTYELAGQLRARQDLTIVTNDLRIAQLVASYPGVRLMVSGGELLRSTYSLVGDRAVDFIRELSVDWAFLGADAIDAGCITNTNTIEIPLKRAMLAVARSAALLADSSKFGRRALVRVAEIGEVDRVITDGGLPDELAAGFGRALQRVPVAPSERGDHGHALDGGDGCSSASTSERAAARR